MLEGMLLCTRDLNQGGGACFPEHFDIRCSEIASISLFLPNNCFYFCSVIIAN